MRIPPIPADRSIRLLLVGLCGTVLLSLHAWHQMSSSRRIAIESVAQYRECCHLAERIRTLTDRPMRAADRLQTATEFAHALEKTAQSVKIELEQLIRIDPRPVRQIANTPYREQPTYFEIRDVTFPQLVSLLHKLSTDYLGMEVVDLRVQAPRSGGTRACFTHEDAQKETWDAEITLTSLVFDP